MKVFIRTAIVDGKHISYTTATEFLIQVGKDYKSSYKTKYRIVGNITQALMYYKGINVGNGHKKRLRVPSFNRPTLARQFS